MKNRILWRIITLLILSYQSFAQVSFEEVSGLRKRSVVNQELVKYQTALNDHLTVHDLTSRLNDFFEDRSDDTYVKGYDLNKFFVALNDTERKEVIAEIKKIDSIENNENLNVVFKETGDKIALKKGKRRTEARIYNTLVLLDYLVKKVGKDKAIRFYNNRENHFNPEMKNLPSLLSPSANLNYLSYKSFYNRKGLEEAEVIANNESKIKELEKEIESYPKKEALEELSFSLQKDIAYLERDLIPEEELQVFPQEKVTNSKLAILLDCSTSVAEFSKIALNSYLYQVSQLVSESEAEIVIYPMSSQYDSVRGASVASKEFSINSGDFLNEAIRQCNKLVQSETTTEKSADRLEFAFNLAQLNRGVEKIIIISDMEFWETYENHPGGWLLISKIFQDFSETFSEKEAFMVMIPGKYSVTSKDNTLFSVQMIVEKTPNLDFISLVDTYKIIEESKKQNQVLKSNIEEIVKKQSKVDELIQNYE